MAYMHQDIIIYIHLRTIDNVSNMKPANKQKIRNSAGIIFTGTCVFWILCLNIYRIFPRHRAFFFWKALIFNLNHQVKTNNYILGLGAAFSLSLYFQHIFLIVNWLKAKSFSVIYTIYDRKYISTSFNFLQYDTIMSIYLFTLFILGQLLTSLCKFSQGFGSCIHTEFWTEIFI